MIATAFAGCLDNGFGNAEINVPAAGIHIVMLEEHGRRQDDIGEFRGLCHELFVNDQKQIVAAEALMHLVLVRTDNGRIGVLDQHRLDRRATLQVLFVAEQDRAETAHVELADRLVSEIETHHQVPIQRIHPGVAVEATTALVRPFTSDDRKTRHRMHVDRPVPRTRETVADADEGTRRLAVKRRQFFDLRDGQAGNLSRPLG